MRYFYVLLTFCGFACIGIGALIFVTGLFGQNRADASLFLAGLVMLALCDISSKLSGLNKRLDAIESQQKRLRRLFLDLTPGAPIEEVAESDD